MGRAKAKELREARIGWSERYWVRWVLVNGCVCVCMCVCVSWRLKECLGCLCNRTIVFLLTSAPANAGGQCQ